MERAYQVMRVFGAQDGVWQLVKRRYSERARMRPLHLCTICVGNCKQGQWAFKVALGFVLVARHHTWYLGIETALMFLSPRYPQAQTFCIMNSMKLVMYPDNFSLTGSFPLDSILRDQSHLMPLTNELAES